MQRAKNRKLPDPAPTPKIPGWFTKDLLEPFTAGVASVFIVHGDINGIVPNPDAAEEPEIPYFPMREFLAKVFDEREMVISYNIASGMRFGTPEMEQRFRRLVGLEEAKMDGADPIAAAKANLVAKRGLPREPEVCLPLIEKALRSMDGVAVMIKSAHFIAPEAVSGLLAPNDRVHIERLRRWGQDSEIRRRQNIILLFTDQAAKISAELRLADSEIRAVSIPKPMKEERAAFVTSLIRKVDERRAAERRVRKLRAELGRSKKGRRSSTTIEAELVECEDLLASLEEPFVVPDNFDLAVFAHVTQGLSLRQILEVFLQSRTSGRPVDITFVRDRKSEILNAEYGDVLKVVEPRNGLDDIGGLDYVKAYFLEVLDAIRRGDTLMIPMGAMLMGPPGTAKTAFVEALAKEAGFNFVKVSNLRSMWVGASEARGEKLLTALRSLAPVVVMNDEADLAEMGRDAPSGDSGVSERLMRMWMEFRSDPRILGKVIVIDCTNRPDRIDPALKRSGRSDERLLLPMPSETERPAIFAVMFRRHKIPTSITDFRPFAKLTGRHSGADIEKIVRSSYRFAEVRGVKGIAGVTSVDADSLRAAIDDFIPSGNQGEIDRMTLLGLLESSSRRLLPPHTSQIVAEIGARGLIKDFDGILARLRERNIVPLANIAAA